MITNRNFYPSQVKIVRSLAPQPLPGKKVKNNLISEEDDTGEVWGKLKQNILETTEEAVGKKESLLMK